MYILNVRFSGEIHFYKEVDESFGGIDIPPMTLQPIIENAVKYGLESLEREKKLTLSVGQEGNEVCISVRDNGIGMDQETIDLILSRALAPTPTKREANGIGLSNVLARMNLFYGGRSSVIITSEGFDMGTDIAIYIPIE
jgi:sensor histidine kinase YesM